MAKHGNGQQIILTKLSPPATSGPLTGRPRLLAHTADILRHRLTLVRAAAGFGKSTLLAQWRDQLVREGIGVAWISLDAADVDPAHVLAHVILSLGRSTAAISELTASLAREFSFCNVRVLISNLISDVMLHAEPICIMLDDAHAIESEAVRSALTYLVDHAPPNLNIVIASRECLWMNLGRMRAFGQLFELTTENLRFSAEELSVFVTNSGFTGDARNALEKFAATVEGWVAGLQCAIATARVAPEHLSQIAELGGSSVGIAEFFKEEVLERHSADYFDFLLRSSILTRMCASLCEAVTGRPDSQEMLERVVDEGLFIFSLDQERTWYRYHHLFGDFLLGEARRRDPKGLPALHGLASSWYEERGYYAEAFHHLIQANDFDAAGAMLARVCEEMFCRGEITALLDWAGQIPVEVILKYPTIDLIAVWWLTVEWRFAEAEQIMARLVSRLEQMPPDAPGTREIRLRIAHQRANIDIFQERMNDTLAISTTLGEEFQDAPSYIRGTFPLMVLHAQIAGLSFKNIAQLAEKSLRDFEIARAPFSLIWHGTVVGTAYLLAGQPAEADVMLRKAMASAQRFQGITGVTSMPATCLANLLLEQNEIAEAKALITTHFGSISYCGVVHQLTFGYVTNIRIAQIDGQWGEAERIIEMGQNFATSRGFERLRLCMIAEKLRLLELLGREEDLERFARGAGIAEPTAHLLPNPSIEAVNLTEIRALTSVRLARRAGRLTEALAICRRWRDFALRREAVLSEIQWRIALADLLCLAGDDRSARRELTQAMLVAAPRGYLRRFIDAGEPVLGQLKAMGSVFESIPVAAEFWRRFRDAVSADDDERHADRSRPATAHVPQLLDPLTHRELAILQCVSAGYLNQEIAERLCLSEGSIKWYLNRIFQKLGVKKRRMAVEQARALGLL